MRKLPFLLATMLFAAPALADEPKAGDAKPADEAKATDAKPSDAAAASTATTAGSVVTDSGEKITDVDEKKGQSYYFIGAHYRGTVIPKFMVNLFVDEGATFYSNNVGLEIEIRKDNFSLIPAISYVEYGFDPVLFLEKGKDPNNVGNWSAVGSSLKAIYATLDVLWSTNLDNKKMFAFEYGLGLGVGVIFGDLMNNWVQKDAAGALVSSSGTHYTQCQAELAAGTGCNRLDHKNPDVPKVYTNGQPYVEKKWFDGGSIPNVFLHLALPEIGIRFKPIKNFQMRLTTAFTLTGFMFGISGYYGTEQIPKTPSTTPPPAEGAH